MTSQQKADFKKGYTYIALSLLSVTVFTLLADYLFRQNISIHPANLLFWSIGGATILSSPYFLWEAHSRKSIISIVKKDWKTVFLIGIISFAGATLRNFALQASSAGIITLMWKMTFIYTIIIGWLFLWEKMNLKEILAILVVIVWLATVGNIQGEVTLTAIVYIVLSCLCYAVLSLVIKRLGKDADMKSVAYIRAISITFFLFVYLVVTWNLEIPNTQVLILWPFSELFGIILWAVFYFEAHRYLPISKLNVFSVVDAVTIPVVAFLVFWDSLSAQKVLWAMCIMVGILWFFHEQMKLQKEK